MPIPREEPSVPAGWTSSPLRSEDPDPSLSAVEGAALPDLAPGGVLPVRYPRYRVRLDGPLLGIGAGAFLTSFLVSDRPEPVPPEGLDPARIRWGLDRDIIGNRDEDADRASDWTRNVSLAFPLAVALATGPRGERLEGAGRRAGVYVEAYLLAQGVVRIGKIGLGRARPFAYLPEGERPASSGYDASEDRAFRAMPSGHSATAWLAVGVGITEHLLSRPGASALERVSISFLGGALAGSTSALRVKAGQHFPSDVLVGGALGTAVGVTVPLLHRGDRPHPSRRSWLEAAGGVAAGALAGGLLAGAL